MRECRVGNMVVRATEDRVQPLSMLVDMCDHGRRPTEAGGLCDEVKEFEGREGQGERIKS